MAIAEAGAEADTAPPAARNAPQEATLHALTHADGSASLTQSGVKVLATVNGPLEAQRRDEQPEEAVVEVHVRPPSGPGSPRDRQIEHVVSRTLGAIILLPAMPRMLVQVTLQLVSTPSDAITNSPPSQSDSVLPLLAPLINASVLALLAGNIPMRRVCMAVQSADDSEASRHVFAFDQHGECLLAESEGAFVFGEWQAASEQALVESRRLHHWLRGLVGRDLESRGRWRENL